MMRVGDLRMMPFNNADTLNFVPNRFAADLQNYRLFSMDDVQKWSVSNRAGKVLAFVFYRQMAEKEFAAFFALSEAFATKHCANFKKLVQMLIERHGAKEVWTVSAQNPELAKWHAFFGMKRTSSVLVEDKPCDVWRMQWE